MSIGVSTTELMQTELGKAFVEARQKAESAKQHYKTNEIGEQEVVAWNPYKLVEKNKYAKVIAESFDKMIQETIPQDVVLSTRFQNWITKTKNELMTNSVINKDNYFKRQMDFNTGEVFENRSNAILEKQMEHLEKQLSVLQKSFKKHMAENPEIAFASKEQLEKWQNYYASQAQKVNQILENGDYSYYDKKDKEGNVIHAGTQEDAKKHQEHLSNLTSKIDNAIAEQETRVNQESPKAPEPDYVGDALENQQRQIHKKQ
ncbi:hypothetical protein [Helicobacter turcicus]|uniref:Uncharacterized protein n=1 Tax=Helicobacter turcicus TaxID=2867412 RepID=A0ABS7JPE4_9HELI|nr:hypothetical protein [Helicobacter turcicus]MBX7491272.1 hypothetical protein [Helicobacter turcicus]MBX7546089.1 hypothetical protein [Helicobacter turcicus]